MGSLGEEEIRFFDAPEEDIAAMSCSNSNFPDPSVSSLEYDLWIRSPRSVKERRSKFLDWMGVDLEPVVSHKSVDDRMRDSSSAVMRKSGFDEEFMSCRSSLSCFSNESFDLSEFGSEVKFVSREGNSGAGAACNVDEFRHDAMISRGSHMISEQLATVEESEDNSSSSFSYQQFREGEDEDRNKLSGGANKSRNRWLNMLRSLSCVVDNQGKADRMIARDDDENDASLRGRIKRVKVRQSKKRSKELSAVYKAQDIQAHDGSIVTMKFSPDGQYLASAGEDGVIRVWQVVEDERCNDIDIPEMDPSCLYFSVNHRSELKPLSIYKEKVGNMKKTSDSAVVIFPHKVFRILEKPLHEFCGHSDVVLDLSWSNKNYLLSSSMDKTVRLWQVGGDHCLRVFSHSNYVTCVQFNPVDENYFISGSIDGKVRIWEISTCHVVDWTDIRDMVTSVCYRPDGQGGIVGSMAGTCRFYHMSDNILQLDAQICLSSKKKSVCRRITGLQFFPQDSSKVMVTCADSQVRILQGLNVIGKYKGQHSAGNQAFASLTSDGKHIISACEDSNVYMWNCAAQENRSLSKAMSIKSCERFSTNASIAVPWCGLKHGNPENGRQFQVLHDNMAEPAPYSSPAYFSLSQEYYLESFPKGAATWPEEKLPPSSLSPSMSSALNKSQYKFLKLSCQSTLSSHAWGLVIVTAGSDGRIRSFLNYGLPVAA